MSKRENLLKQIRDAERKVKQIQEHIAQSEKKKSLIDNDIRAQQEKIRKILFFLEKTRKTLQSKEP